MRPEAVVWQSKLRRPRGILSLFNLARGVRLPYGAPRFSPRLDTCEKRLDTFCFCSCPHFHRLFREHLLVGVTGIVVDHRVGFLAGDGARLTLRAARLDKLPRGRLSQSVQDTLVRQTCNGDLRLLSAIAMSRAKLKAPEGENSELKTALAEAVTSQKK
jgi:hypothetical protein